MDPDDLEFPPAETTLDFPLVAFPFGILFDKILIINSVFIFLIIYEKNTRYNF